MTPQSARAFLAVCAVCAGLSIVVIVVELTPDAPANPVATTPPPPSPSSTPVAPVNAWPTAQAPAAAPSVSQKAAPFDPKVAVPVFADKLLDAFRFEDEAYVRKLMPPEVASDPVKRTEWNDHMEELAKASAALDEKAGEKGFNHVMEWQNGEAVLKLYRARGASAGHALRFKHVGDGQWHMVGRTWTKD